jgi:hypothetical protein
VPQHPLLGIEDKNLGDYFRENGFVVVRDVARKDALDRVEADIRNLVAAQLSRLGRPPFEGKPLIDDLSALHSIKIETYLASVRLAAKLASVMDLFMGGGPASIAEQLGISVPAFQTAPVIHLMSDRLRIPGGYYGAWTHTRTGRPYKADSTP